MLKVPQIPQENQSLFVQYFHINNMKTVPLEFTDNCPALPIKMRAYHRFQVPAQSFWIGRVKSDFFFTTTLVSLPQHVSRK